MADLIAGQVQLMFNGMSSVLPQVAIVTKLNADIRKALAAPDVIQRLSSLGSEPAASTSEEFAAYLKQDYARWSSVVKTAGIKVE